MFEISFLALSAAALPVQCMGVAEPVIDVHLHSYAMDPRWAVRAPNPSTGKPLTAIGEEALRNATLAELRKNSVIRAIVDDDGAAGTDRQSAARVVAADPQRMRLGIDATDLSPAVFKRIRALHAEGKLAAIAEIGTQYRGLAPDDPEVEPLWALAEELDLPVGLHMGLGWPGVNADMPKMRMRDGDPLRLEDVLVRHPKLRVYVMHAGWPHLDGLIAMLHSFPNLMVDIGVIDWAIAEPEFHFYLKRIVGAGFADRVMYGSDQMVWPDAISLSLERIGRADYLTNQQRRDILFNNAVRFFRWDDLKPCA